MLIKLQDFEDSKADQLKAHFGQKTASGAVREAANRYFDLYQQHQELLRLGTEYRAEIERKNQIIENARSAAAALLDKTAQGDLL